MIEKQITKNDAVDLLIVTTKTLLPESEIPFYEVSNPQILEGFVGLRSLCQFDIEEIKQNKSSERFLSLLKTRLIRCHYDIIDLATETIESLGGTTTCKWHQNGYHLADYWETGCDNMFQFTTGGPANNRFEFCPYCSKPIEEVEDESV